MNATPVFARLVRWSAVVVAAVLFTACTDKSPEKLLASARDYLAKNEVNAAIIQLKNVLQQAPDNGEARLMLGLALMQQRDLASAEKELRRALDLGQSPDAVLPSLARAMAEQGASARLVKDYGDRTLTSPEAQAAFSTTIGEAQLGLGKATEAAAAFEAALKAKPDYGLARLGQALLAAIGGDREGAMKITDAVIAAAPGLAQAHVLKADLHSAQGNRIDARKSLEQAVGADGNYLPARRALARFLIEDKRYEEAAAQIDAARKVSRGDLMFNYLQGLLDFEKGDVAKARDSVAQVLKYAPDNVPSLVLAGAIDIRMNQIATGESNLRKAIAQAPNHQGARRLLVGTYLQSGQPARALEVLQPLLTSEASKDPRVMMLAGETFLANGDLKQAQAYFTSASGGEAVKVVAQTRLGQLALARGDSEQGFKQLELAAEQDSKSVQPDLALISAHLRRNEFDKALAAAKALEKKQPDNPLSQLMLGIVEAARKDLASARKRFERALEIQPSYLPAVASLANLDLADKKPDDARKRFEAVIAREPKNDQAYLALAELQLRTGGKPEDVVATLQRAITANPQAVAPRAALINMHLQQRDTKAALQVGQDAVAAMPNEPRLLGALANAQEAVGSINQAIETLNKLATLQPQSPQPLQQLAALHSRKQQFDLALDALRRAQRVAPDDRGVKVDLLLAYARAGKFDDALKEAKALQSKDPKFAAAFALEGEIHAAQKKWPEAERTLREALKLEPRAGRAATQLHAVLTAAGKARDADAFARKWIADNPKDVAMRLYLADRAMNAKDNKTALGLYQETIALDPNNAIALNNLAFVAGELGDARAIGYAERAVKLAPNSPAILDTLGVLLVNKGEIQKGFEYLDKVRTLMPNAPTLRVNYAKALLKAGRKDEARKELESLKAVAEAFAGKEEIDGLLKAL